MTSAASEATPRLDSSSSARPVSVLLVVRELGLGGIERDVTKLALGFDRSRFIPYVATYRPSGPRFDELAAAGVPVLHLDLSSLASVKAITAAWEFRCWIRRFNIEIVHAFDPSSVFAVPLARLLRVPVVLSSQLGHRELHDPRTRKQLKLVDRLSDLVVVNCEALRRHLIQQHQLPPEKVDLCYNGVDTRQFYPAPLQRVPEVAGAPLVIGTVCVLRSEKGLDLLVKAFAEVRNLVPGAKLLIVGNGPELPKLVEASRSLDILDDCVFKPAVASVAPVLQSLDLFVSCSHSEAFSNSILEAMASGRCVVGSRVGGTPELLGENERGLLFESGNAADLAAKLSTLIRNVELRSTLASAAAEFARTELSVEKNIARTSQIYDSMLALKRIRH